MCSDSPPQVLYSSIQQWNKGLFKSWIKLKYIGKKIGSGGPGRALWIRLLHKSKGRYSPRSRRGQAPRESVIPTKAGIHFNYWKSMDSRFCENDCLKKTIYVCDEANCQVACFEDLISNRPAELQTWRPFYFSLWFAWQPVGVNVINQLMKNMAKEGDLILLLWLGLGGIIYILVRSIITE